MPIRRRGYHHWDGRLASDRWTWLAISGTGLRLGMRQKNASLLIWSALPLSVMAGVLFYLLAVVQNEGAGVSRDIVGVLLAFVGLGRGQAVNMAQMVVPMWTIVFARLCQVELFFLLLVQAKFGSDLVSGDLRTNALPIYFSKPITVSTYLLGKWLVAFLFAAGVTILPNLLAYAAGVLLTDPFSQLVLTAGLLARLAAYSFLVAGLASLVILALSSLTRDWRLVLAGWFGLMLLSSVAQGIFDMVAEGEYAGGLLGAVSIPRNVGRLAYWMLGVDGAVEATGHPKLFGAAVGSDVYGVGIGYSVAVLAVIAALCVLICVKRVRRFQVAVANA